MLFLVLLSLQLSYKEKYYNSRGHFISLPITPQLMHCYHVNDITSDVSHIRFTQICTIYTSAGPVLKSFCVFS